MSAGARDHIPLAFDIDNDSDIVYTHEEQLETQCPPPSEAGQPSVARIFRRLFPERLSVPRPLLQFLWPLRRFVDTRYHGPGHVHHDAWPKGVVDHYIRINTKPASDLVESTIRCSIFRPPMSTSDDGNEKSLEAGVVALSEGATFTSFVEGEIEDVLQPPDGKYFQLCILAPNAELSFPYFSFGHKMVQSFTDGLTDMYKTPGLVLAHCLADAWRVDTPIRNTLTGCSNVAPRYPSLLLPSKKSTDDDLGPLSSKGTTLILEWQNEVLKYTNDLSVYVWQPHLRKKADGFCKITIVVMPSNSVEASHKTRQVAIIVKPPNTMPIALQKAIDTRISQRTDHSWTATHELLHFLLLLLEWMADDTAHLVDSITYEVREMTLRGRRMPSRSKIQYLIHLDDCRRRAIEDLTHSLRLSEKTSKAVRSTESCCKDQGDQDRAEKRIVGLRNDTNFLIDRLVSLEKPITAVRLQILEQMNLAQGQRALILTIAAALFVPLSFVSGIFGMNVKQPLFPKTPSATASASTYTLIRARATTSPTVTASTTTPPSSSNTGDGSDEQHLFTMPLYLETALPLTAAVIIFPLIIGPLIRFSVQTAARYRIYWRILCVVGAIAYFPVVYGVLFHYSMDPWSNPDYHASCGCWLASTGDEVCSTKPCDDDDLNDKRPYACYIAYNMLTIGVLLITAFTKIVQAWKKKKSRLLWLFFVFFVTTLSGLELRVMQRIPVTWIAFLFLFVLYIEPYQWRRPFHAYGEILRMSRLGSLLSSILSRQP